MDFAKLINILSGRFNDLPKEKSKVVRIFLSSTFTGECSKAFSFFSAAELRCKLSVSLHRYAWGERLFDPEHLSQAQKLLQAQLWIGLSGIVVIRLIITLESLKAQEPLTTSRYWIWDGVSRVKSPTRIWPQPYVWMRSRTAKSYRPDPTSSWAIKILFLTFWLL